MKILRIDASARRADAISRSLMDRLVTGLGQQHDVTTRDLSEQIAQIDALWIAANNAAEDQRTASDRAALALSDALVTELEEADLIIIGMPVYNFGVPASLKAWIDQICRARRTFEYTSAGPRGLLTDKKAIVCYISGGTEMGSQVDFASGYIRHILAFIGIVDVRFIDAGRLMFDDDALQRAASDVDAVASLTGRAA